MSKALPKRSENYSEWYNEIVKRADLAENSTIKVEVTDLSMISAGDAIKVTGKSVTAESVLAEDVSVTLANVLTGPKKKERRAARGKAAKEESPFKPLDVKQ